MEKCNFIKQKANIYLEFTRIFRKNTKDECEQTDIYNKS